MALFAGMTLGGKVRPYAVPLLAMAASDLVLGLFVFGLAETVRYTIPVYLAMALTVPLGQLCGRSVSGIMVGGTVAALIFFFAVNGFYWGMGTLYPRTGEGLLACYAAAVPFALNMWAANLAYGLGLHATMRWAESRWPVLRVAPVELDER